ncbi:class I SAM-dependent methyltransferase [Shigella flexneri]
MKQAPETCLIRSGGPLGLEHDEDNLMALGSTPEHLELRKRDEPKLGGIFVYFVGGAMAHRRKFGGGRGEAVAKAVGIKSDHSPDVVDATAGLGRDAFVLASVGCRVRMLERNPSRCPSTTAWRVVMRMRKSAAGCRARP